MKVIFLGTPDFGVPALEQINKYHNVIACVCQPDKAGARGQIEYCAVKKYAIAHHIPLYQFEKISRDGVEVLKELNPDIMVTAAYGQILSQEVIDIPRHGIVNIHGSILPKLRGAAPIQYAVLLGLETTGITILNTVRKVDAGDIILQKSLKIGQYETNGELFERLSCLGAEAIIEALDKIDKGTAVYVPQNEESATFTSKINSEQEKIDWTKTSNEIVNLVRALNPSPVAWTTYRGKRIKIYALRHSDKNYQGVCGQIVEATKKYVSVMCGDGKAVNICELQAENAKRMDIVSYLCGRKMEQGEVLGE